MGPSFSHTPTWAREGGLQSWTTPLQPTHFVGTLPPRRTKAAGPNIARFNPDFIIDAVESAGLYSDARILELNSYENRVYQVGIEDKPPVIAKFYRPDRWPDSAILEEHEFTLSLQEAGVPVVAPLVLPGGHSLGQYGDFRFAVFPQRGGQAPDTSVTDTLYRLGQWLGQIHNIGALKPFEHGPGFDLLAGWNRTTRCWWKVTGFPMISNRPGTP